MILLLSANSMSLWAAEPDNWSFCPKPFVPSEIAGDTAMDPDLAKSIAAGDTVIEADQVIAKRRELLELRGSIQFRNLDTKLRADRAQYDLPQQSLQAQGNVRFESEQLITVGESASLNMKENQGNIDNIKFWLSDSHLRGSASQIQLDSENQSRLHSVAFTSCMDGNNDWELSASYLRLNTEENVGEAHNARLLVRGIPVFYFPYLSFPLQGRKSGLLVPEIGRSSITGRYLGIPYYFNIAPNRDATVTPRYYEHRGTMLDTQYRYLHANSKGQLDYAYLAKDKGSNEQRYNGKYEMVTTPTEEWYGAVSYHRVSDTDYLDEFGDSYGAVNISHLEQSGTLQYRGRWWLLSTEVLRYQTVDEQIAPLDKPYQRLPNVQVNLAEQRLPLGLRYSLHMDYVRFDREQGLTGRRTDIAPSFGLPYNAAAGFIRPAVTMRYTKYQLAGQDPSNDAQPTRSVPQWSLHSGLFFERDMRIRGRAHVQTLEPELYYLYVPFRDQSDLPSFDSNLAQNSFSQLFRNNRFTGRDRIGDTSQVTAALTSRINDIQGRERFRLSLGQAYYLKQRRVGLSGEILDETNHSDLISEVSSQWSKSIQVQANHVWQSRDEVTQKSLFRFRYVHDKDKMLSLNYRFQRGIEEQADATFLWRLNYNWKGVAHWRHSLRESEYLERYLGLEYQSCCWAIRVLQRDYLSEDRLEENSTVEIQVELKGLSNVGQELNKIFESGS